MTHSRWHVFGRDFTEIPDNFDEVFLKKFFQPFPESLWENDGELLISYNGEDNQKIEAQFGYFRDNKIAISIECYDKSNSGKGWKYCVGTEGDRSGEIFYTKNEIFFPVMSLVDADTAFKVAINFVSDPKSLPSSVNWVNDLEIDWPEIL